MNNKMEKTQQKRESAQAINGVYDADACSQWETTGLIPAMPMEKEQENSYEHTYNYEPNPVDNLNKEKQTHIIKSNENSIKS